MPRGLKALLWALFLLGCVDVIADYVALQGFILVCVCIGVKLVLFRKFRVSREKRFSPRWIPHSRPRQKRSDLNGVFQKRSDLNGVFQKRSGLTGLPQRPSDLNDLPQKRSGLDVKTGSYDYLVEKFDNCVRIFKAQGNKPMLQYDNHNAGDGKPDVQDVTTELNLNNNFSDDKNTPASDDDDCVVSDEPINPILTSDEPMNAILATSDDPTTKSTRNAHHVTNGTRDAAAEDIKVGFLAQKYTEAAGQATQRLLGLVGLTMASEPQPLVLESGESLSRPYGASVMAVAGLIQNEILAAFQCL